MTEAIGGVPVCLKRPEHEVRSGVDLPAGPQIVSGADALAFVRQRHGLEGGDLDRIARQQAFLAGMASRMLSTGTLSDPGAVRRLVDAVTRNVVLDRGWNLDRLITQFGRMSGGDIRFVTIPTGTPALETPVDGIAVQVDTARSAPSSATPSPRPTPRRRRRAAPTPEPATTPTRRDRVRGAVGADHRHLRRRSHLRGLTSVDARVVRAAALERARRRRGSRPDPGPRAARSCSATATSTAACTAAGETYGSTARAASSDRGDRYMVIIVVHLLCGEERVGPPSGYRRAAPTCRRRGRLSA